MDSVCFCLNDVNMTIRWKWKQVEQILFSNHNSWRKKQAHFRSFVSECQNCEAHQNALVLSTSAEVWQQVHLYETNRFDWIQKEIHVQHNCIRKHCVQAINPRHVLKQLTAV